MHIERAIIHLNIADFAVAVERTVDRRLMGRPVIIAPQGSVRAAVYDMSEEAYRSGVRKHMRLQQALRRCRDASVLPPRPQRYEAAMRLLMKRVLPYSPLIENGEQDGHLFVDVSGSCRLFGPPIDIAWRLGKRIKKDLDMDAIWSVAANKLVAKVATRLVKPKGEYVVGSGEEALFLAPLPVGLIPGVEYDDVCRLRDFNLSRVSQVTALSREQLQVPFGRRAAFIHDIMRGIDPSPVLPVGDRAPRVQIDQTLATDTNARSVLENVLYAVVEKAGRRLRKKRLAARRIRITVDYSDGLRCARQRSITPASANDATLFKAGCRTLQSVWRRRVRIRHMGLICDRLVFPPAQLPLFAAARRAEQRRDDLMHAVDRIRERFGHQVLRLRH